MLRNSVECPLALPARHSTDRLYGRFTRCKTWVQFLSFLKGVRRPYPARQTLHSVLDNYGWHLKAEVLSWVAIHNRGRSTKVSRRKPADNLPSAKLANRKWR